MLTAVKTYKETNIPKLIETINILDYEAKIAETAYYKAERRLIESGHEVGESLKAKQELGKLHKIALRQTQRERRILKINDLHVGTSTGSVQTDNF